MDTIFKILSQISQDLLSLYCIQFTEGSFTISLGEAADSMQ